MFDIGPRNGKARTEVRVGNEQVYMVTADLLLEVTSFSDEAERIFGLPAARALGRSLPEVVCAKEFLSAAHAIMLEVVKGKVEWQGEMLARRRDGRLFQSQVRITPIEDHHGNVTGLLAVGRDMSAAETLADPRTNYVQYLVNELGLAPSTAYTYCNNLERIEKFAGKPIADIGVDDLRRFLRETDYHPGTKSGVLVAVRSHHKWGALEGKWNLNGIMAVQAPRQVRTMMRPPLTPDQACKLMDACRYPNEFRLVYLGLYAGTRVSDSAIIGEKEWLSDRLRFTMVKTRRLQEIPVHPELVDARSRILESNTSRSTLKQVARSLAFYTGIPFTSHTLRRTFSRRLLDEKVSEGIVIDLLGHAPTSVLRGNYAEVTFSEKSWAIGKLSYPHGTLEV